MNKKLISILLCIFIAIGMVACGAPEAPGSSGSQGITESKEGENVYKPGKYTATVSGHNGSVVVETEFSADAIIAVKVIEESETNGLTDLPIQKIPQEIVEKQSLSVDTITGATITSYAIKQAVENCVEQAGGDITALNQSNADKKLSTEIVELETDVIVVGGGSAGLTAALTAKEQGYDVILLEKTASLGGHTLLSGGMIPITGSKAQKEKYGITNDSPELVYQDMYKNGGEKSVPELLKLFSENMGEATDWVVDSVGAKLPDKLNAISEFTVDRSATFEGKGIGLIEAFKNKIATTDVEILYDTPAKKLITENGKVVGVEAVAKNGVTYKIKAQATILATGGFGNNKELLPDSLKRFIYYGASSSNGDGLRMATEIGAATLNMEYAERFPNGVEWVPGLAKSTYYGTLGSFEVSSILVDKSGNRVVNEKGPDPDIIAKQAEQSDATLYLFLDKASFDMFRETIGGTGISQEMLDGWLANNGKNAPIFANADTIEEVSEIVGVDAQALKNTVERYNGFVEKGVDEDFGRSGKYLEAKIGEGPYYLIEQKPRYATTLGGLVVNTNLEVLNTDGNVIPGLLSVGETAGGTLGNDSAPGADIGWAITSGRVAGKYLPQIIK